MKTINSTSIYHKVFSPSTEVGGERGANFDQEAQILEMLGRYFEQFNMCLKQWTLNTLTSIPSVNIHRSALCHSQIWAAAPCLRECLTW